MKNKGNVKPVIMHGTASHNRDQGDLNARAPATDPSPIKTAIPIDHPEAPEERKATAPMRGRTSSLRTLTNANHC